MRPIATLLVDVRGNCPRLACWRKKHAVRCCMIGMDVVVILGRTFGIAGGVPLSPGREFIN